MEEQYNAIAHSTPRLPKVSGRLRRLAGFINRFDVQRSIHPPWTALRTRRVRRRTAWLTLRISATQLCLVAPTTRSPSLQGRGLIPSAIGN